MGCPKFPGTLLIILRRAEHRKVWNSSSSAMHVDYDIIQVDCIPIYLSVWDHVLFRIFFVVDTKQEVLILWSSALVSEITLLMVKCCQLLGRDQDLPVVAWKWP